MGTIGLQRGVQNLLIGAGRENKVSLWTCESRALFQGWMITRWSILYRFYPQTSACSI
jgi:hypothetical protein